VVSEPSVQEYWKGIGTVLQQIWFGLVEVICWNVPPIDEHLLENLANLRQTVLQFKHVEADLLMVVLGEIEVDRPEDGDRPVEGDVVGAREFEGGMLPDTETGAEGEKGMLPEMEPEGLLVPLLDWVIEKLEVMEGVGGILGVPLFVFDLVGLREFDWEGEGGMRDAEGEGVGAFLLQRYLGMPVVSLHLRVPPSPEQRAISLSFVASSRVLQTVILLSSQ